MNILIEEIIQNGINVVCQWHTEKKQFQYIIEGFYKSGQIVLTVESNTTLLAIARYDERTAINCFDDLVYLNHEWWQRSKDRNECWSNPEQLWLPHMIRLNLVKKQVIPEQIIYK